MDIKPQKPMAEYQRSNRGRRVKGNRTEQFCDGRAGLLTVQFSDQVGKMESSVKIKDQNETT